MIHPLYAQDIDSLIQDPAIPWDSLKGKAIVLSGGTGLVGRYVVDAVLEADSHVVLITAAGDTRLVARFCGKE